MAVLVVWAWIKCSYHFSASCTTLRAVQKEQQISHQNTVERGSCTMKMWCVCFITIALLIKLDFNVPHTKCMTKNHKLDWEKAFWCVCESEHASTSTHSMFGRIWISCLCDCVCASVEHITTSLESNIRTLTKLLHSSKCTCEFLTKHTSTQNV